ncbi:MAG: lipid A deacylase LpxR family protein [Candidatus Thiodiazotropha sp.]|nr:lipid A deacylase LpxR family protein [Candidatus Thiodiazotropha sp.]MCM8883953.1 lipid A deacylase LpxR family protein [Candidatus Thiodiazotropha sp.]
MDTSLLTHILYRFRGARRSLLTLLLLGILVSTTTVAQEQTAVSGREGFETEELFDTGWQFYFDNDISFNDEKDRNYTGGVALTLSGKRTAGYWFSIDDWLNGLDRLSGFESLLKGNAGINRHALEFGLTIFTPDDIAEQEAISDDHPYANMLFMANSQTTVYSDRGLIFQSTLLLGLLGTAVGEQVQKTIHNLTDSDEPQGWKNQISEGGELTAKYTLSAQKVLLSHQGNISYDIRGGVEAGVGYSTDLNSSISFRLGKLNTPWWSFIPHQSEYISLGQTFGDNAQQGANPAELFVWGGLNLKYRLYNAILQGQFRDSAVTYDHDDLEPLILDGWLGITKTFRNGFGIRFVMRKQNYEIKGSGRNDPFWSGLIISRTY